MIKPRLSSAIVLLALLSTSCTKSKTKGVKSSERAAYGSALVEISGGKQAAPVGSTLDQPVVVQVNDDKGTAVSNVAVHFNGPAGALFNPTMVLTDSSGQASTALSMGSAPGRYR